MTAPQLDILTAQTVLADAIAQAGDGSYAWDSNEPSVKAIWVLEELMNMGFQITLAPVNRDPVPPLCR